MAGQMIGPARGGRRRRRGGYRPLSEINVTPFVDVMLVLLIVFMVTAPLLTVGVPVELPRTEARAIEGQDEPLVVTVDREGRIFVGQDRETELESLVPLLVAISDSNPEARIFVRGDKDLAYGRIMDVMGRITAAGFTRMALIAELPEPTASR